MIPLRPAEVNTLLPYIFPVNFAQDCRARIPWNGPRIAARESPGDFPGNVLTSFPCAEMRWPGRAANAVAPASAAGKAARSANIRATTPDARERAERPGRGLHTGRTGQLQLRRNPQLPLQGDRCTRVRLCSMQFCKVRGRSVRFHLPPTEVEECSERRGTRKRTRGNSRSF